MTKYQPKIQPLHTFAMLWLTILMMAAFATQTAIAKPKKSALDQFSAMKNAGLLVTDLNGEHLLDKRSNDRFIPASTTKLVTGWLALEHWGEQHRFVTDFYFDTATNTLWVKGSGDPFLVSEELAVIARNIQTALAKINVTNIDVIGLDTSLFADQLVLPGTGSTNNPYDAVPSAVAANFNTVNLKRINGKITSAEKQTPITPIAKSLGKRFKGKSLRVNTGTDPRKAERYFAELLSAFLRQQNINVNDKVVYGSAQEVTPLYSHKNSKTVGEMIQPMMKYSTNFIANQIILMLAAEQYGGPVTVAQVKQVMETKLATSFGWSNFTMEDGAGLSRKNRLSPQQLVQLLEKFRPWKHLLPEIEPGVFAKSGTLNGVSTLAGYIVVNNEWQAFALMMNEAVPYKLSNRIARQLRKTRY